MINITYDPFNGIHVADGDCEGKALQIACKEGDYVVSSQLIVDHLRLLVKIGAIKPENITFNYKGETMACNKDGRLSHWPKGFCDYFENVLDKLLD